MWSPSNKRDSLINSDDALFPFLLHFPGLHPRQMFSSFFASRSRGSWIPAVDILEQDDGYTLVADLPEVKKEDLRVYTESSSIICISGNRKHVLKQDEHQLLVAERGTGRFERCFDLPTPVDSSKIKATFNDQQLNVSIPKLRNSRSGTPNSVTID
ncbi:putative heat shock protein 20 [Leishmania mexicana MHOM/GT/2001/U1103]|uniref:Heat shock protein 20 n=1 Tax=Leishmania mexicana (strain MHOM/GT/2001/U1103) TaxID=929439 RepID=E9ALH9_LEIMU|nr:putative heat shock protein 20 [Leishmania mexicana MHOM/GT/2001/U1103]CBZ23783.1 putative heat shock protein 20 [Leishmania mexicana MHOM/GT/2001/U1103]